jgi:hypothetical protein
MKLFIEVYSYHMETMYPLVVKDASEGDLLLFNSRTNGVEMLDEFKQTKLDFSFKRIWRLLRNNDVTHIYINTISLNLYARTFQGWSKALKILCLPLLKILKPNVQFIGVLHEADQYCDVDVETNLRHRLFKNLVGRHLLKLFQKIYVLAPEVQQYLFKFGLKTELLSTKPLKNLVAMKQNVNSEDSRQRIVWIGSVDLMRRNWKPLLKLKKTGLNNIVFDMVCDINVSDGKQLRQFVDDNGLSEHFVFRTYRPDDSELYEAVQKADYVACFYSHSGYGRYKTSGARHTALAFDKKTIVFDGVFKYIDRHGETRLEHSEINSFIKLLMTT